MIHGQGEMIFENKNNNKFENYFKYQPNRIRFSFHIVRNIQRFVKFKFVLIDETRQSVLWAVNVC